jgi:hypothetical protein
LRCIGRLQTDADREYVVDGLSAAGSKEQAREIEGTIQRLGPRWLVLRDVHTDEGPMLLQPRWALSWLRGPMTRTELQQALRRRRGVEG